MEAIAICLFGMESTVSYELKNLGFEIVRVNDGRVTFKTDSLGIARANICLRCAERVVVKVGDFFADSFEQLFDQIALLPFEKYLNQDSKFHVAKVRSINSRLVSAKDIQSIVKKSIIERLRKKLGADHFPETQGEHRIHIFINKNIVEVSFDTTGAALHKRGYRELSGEAPLRETIAAFMVMGSPWKRRRLLVDPMCGSGTIAIEAALYGANIMPGVNRNFAGESLNFISPKDWVYARKEAIEGESHEEFKIFASDKDPKMIHLAKENAIQAGVEHLIEFQVMDATRLAFQEEYGFIITNPPYGERMGEEKEVIRLYQAMGKMLEKLPTWSMYMITSLQNVEELFRRKATKKRNIYNGSLKSILYSFQGEKPARGRQ